MNSVIILTLLLTHIVNSLVNSNDVCKKADASDGLYIQRQKSKQPLSYDTERTPSYCDRIVLGSTEKSQVDVYQYTAITDEYIDYSDHDLVYGFFSFDGMNILTITWNVGKFVSKSAIKKQSAWDDIICSVKTALTKHIQSKSAAANDAENTAMYPSWDEIDIFAVGFQETKWPFALKYLTKSLKKSVHGKKNKWNKIISHEGPGLLSARNTYLYILYNEDRVFHNKKHRIVQKIVFDQGDGFKKGVKKFLRTKSAVIVGRFRKIIKKGATQKVSNKFIAFGNAHLPVDTKNKKDFGVVVREIGMDEVKRKFEMRFNANDNDKGLIVFMGDLNFRVNPNDPEKKYEQLEMYINNKGMEKKNDGYWKELMDLKDKEGKHRFLPTCKRETGSWKKQMEKVVKSVENGLSNGGAWVQRMAEYMGIKQKES